MVLRRWNRNSFKNLLGLSETSLAPSKTHHTCCPWVPQLSLLDTSHFSGLVCLPSSPWLFSVFDFVFPVLLGITHVTDWKRAGTVFTDASVGLCLFLPYSICSPCKRSFLDPQCSVMVSVFYVPQWNTSSLYLKHSPFLLFQMAPPWGSLPAFLTPLPVSSSCLIAAFLWSLKSKLFKGNG